MWKRVSYYGDFVACPLVLLIVAGVSLPSLSLTFLAPWIAGLCVGLILWPLAEYGFHRWIYHAFPVIRAYHDEHHARPSDLLGSPMLAMETLILIVVFAPLAQESLAAAGGLTCGLLAGYEFYMLVHHADHHWVVKPGTFLYNSKMRHVAHHHSRPLVNFGVTSNFWDRMFATSRDSGEHMARV